MSRRPLSAVSARLLLALALASASVAGCAVQGGEAVGSGSAPIIDGVESGIEDNSAVWVGILSAEGYPMGSCSGVLVADNVVLTARHCVARTQSGGIACSKDGRSISGGGVRSDYPADQLAIIVGATMSRKAAAFGKEVVTTGATNLCNNDLALIVLDRRIPDAMIAQIRLEAPPVKGEKILAVGWGVSNNSGSRVRRRRADIPITSVGPVGTTSGVVASNEFAIGEGICSGDSGGPAYSMTTGAVVGVVSRGGNAAPYDPETDPAYTNCVDTPEFDTHNLYTRVDTLKEFVLKAFEAAGSEPWLEGGPDPRKAKTGETCEAGDTCRSGTCIDTGSAKICSEICANEGSTCPTGFSCTAAGDTKICAPTPNAADASEQKGGCAVTTSTTGSSPDVGSFAALGLALAAVRSRRVATRRR